MRQGATRRVQVWEASGTQDFHAGLEGPVRNIEFMSNISQRMLKGVNALHDRLRKTQKRTQGLGRLKGMAGRLDTRKKVASEHT